MHSLRDRWRRGWLYNYFADMPPGGRATALIVLAMLVAFVVSFAAIVRHREPGVTSAPAHLPARPFVMEFAAASKVLRAIAKATRT